MRLLNVIPETTLGSHSDNIIDIVAPVKNFLVINVDIIIVEAACISSTSSLLTKADIDIPILLVVQLLFISFLTLYVDAIIVIILNLGGQTHKIIAAELCDLIFREPKLPILTAAATHSYFKQRTSH